MLMLSELLRAARDPEVAAQLRARSPARFSRPDRGVPIVVWNVVGQCNLSCPHCYASATKAPCRDDLGTKEALGLLDELARANTKVVIFSGGEPLLRHDLFELIARARELGLAPQLSSNGVLIDDAVAERLAKAGIGYVGVSIDGLAAFNDRYRGLEGGFERAAAGLSAAKRAGLKTGLRITLSKLNEPELDRVLDVAVELGVDRFYVSHLLYAGRAFRISSEDLRPSESRAVLGRLFARALAMLDAKGPDIVTGGNDSDGPALVVWVKKRLGARAAERVEGLLRLRRGNSAGEKILAIDHLGRVHPDQFWQAATLGNVRTTPFAEILAAPLRRELEERVKHLEGRCRSCRFIELCRGSHRERALATFKNMWAPDPACVMSDAEIEPEAEFRMVAP